MKTGGNRKMSEVDFIIKAGFCFVFFNDWKQKKPFIDHVGHCPSFTHVCTL